ncbi:MAG: heterodisulfide reductase-related iron-sulfur binding cluster [Halobacteria archaeon]
MSESASEAIAETSRPTFWEIGGLGKIVFYILAVIAVIILLYGIFKRFHELSMGGETKVPRLDDLGTRIKEAVAIVGTNKKQVYQDLFAGVMHTFIMWGFLTLLIATTILGIDLDLYRPITDESFFVGDFYLSYSAVVDFMGLLFVVGVGMALYRRYLVRDSRLWHEHTSMEDDLFIWTLFVLGVGGYIQEGIRILGTGFPDFADVSFVGFFVANVFRSAGVTEAGAQAAYPVLWWMHALIALGFVAWLPYAKPFHMISSFANVVTRDPDAKNTLQGVPADASPDEIGYAELEDFSWKHLLDQDACTKCGRCTSVCPANASGRDLSPRDVILDLKKYREEMEKNGEDEMPIIARGEDSVISPESMDACMSCVACMDACPVEIEHVPQFVEMNRRMTEMGEMNENVQEAMMNIFQNGNSFGDPDRKRPDWTEDLEFEIPDAREEDVEILWYVGDYPSYDEMNQKVAKSLARVFEESDLSYGILYEDEQNDGNDVRRVGEEGLYEMLAEDNIEAFEDASFDRIVCTDPHSYNTFKNEYDQFGWDGEVYHYTQALKQMYESGEIDLEGDELDYTVTYHDPCNLGRFNDVYDAPREMVRATGADLYEMPRNRSNSFCCGGGGGGLWMDFDEDPKPSEERLREALEDTEAGDEVEKFVVACPKCNTMYTDGRKTGGFEDDIDVVDLAQLFDEALQKQGKVAVA